MARNSNESKKEIEHTMGIIKDSGAVASYHVDTYPSLVAASLLNNMNIHDTSTFAVG
jgi:hypothetical protein